VNNRAVQQQDVARILRDLLSAQGLLVSAMRTEGTPDGWRVTVIDAEDRVFSTDIADGPPAAVRVTLTRWLSTHAHE
jgi:hypothetical protein